MKIDSHHHFWHYVKDKYAWIDSSMQQLQRDFLPEDFKPVIDSVGIEGVVSVQARQCIKETEQLLEFGEANDFILGVVGWVALYDAEVVQHLERFSKQPKFCAVRHIVQDEPDDEFILRENFNQGVGLLKRYGLVYDILVFEHHLPAVIQFVDRHPEQVFVLDHVAKPQIGKSLLEPWREHILELSKRPHVYCKLSGMVTEADFESWTPDQLLPYWQTVLEAFGPSRLMFGSDWPVCLLASGYERWYQTVQAFVSDLSPSEQNSIFGDTAIKAYGLEVPDSK